MKLKLLTVSNPKTAKGEAKNYLTAILHLAPYKLAGYNVCPMADIAGCHAGCLNTAGRGGIAKGGRVTYASVRNGTRTNKIQEARIRRTYLFVEKQKEFMRTLSQDIAKLEIEAKSRGLKPCVRLNGTSDIRWEDIPYDGIGGSRPSIMDAFPDVQFYDYTKIPNRVRALDIPNYHLTFSYSGVPEFQPYVNRAIRNYGDKVNIAVVTDYPERFSAETWGRPVVNGDENDLRFLDPKGCIVLLKAKGQAKKDKSGFVVRS